VISVVIPTYNGAAFLRKVLADLRAQTLPPDEILVMDNGSTVESVAVAEAVAVRVLTGSSTCRAVSRGMEEAAGDWLVILNNEESFGWTCERRILVVDNGSTVESVAVAEAVAVRVLTGSSTCRAVNRGMEEAAG